MILASTMTRNIIIAIPPTTSFTVVFPYNQSAGTFDSGFYSPMLTDGRAVIDEINQVLREIEAAHKPCAQKIKSALICYILTLFLGVFGLMGAVFTAPYYVAFAVIGYILFVIAVMVYYIVAVQKYTKESKRVCQAVCDRANQAFSYKGLRWHVPVHFPRWVELWKDYVGQGQMGQMGAQPIYMPPVHQQPSANYGGPYPMGQPQPQYQNNFYQPGYQNNNAGYMPPGQQV